MDRFQDAFTHIMQVEGGYVNDPKDPGGPTKYGITQKTLGLYMGREAMIDDVQGLTLMDAERIYRVLYWEPMHCEEINDSRLGIMFFDQAVNRGVARVIRDIQEALNDNLIDINLKEDGLMGPSTLALINGQMPEMLADWFIQVCEEAYRKRVEQNPSLVRFLDGWLNRVETLKKLFS